MSGVPRVRPPIFYLRASGVLGFLPVLLEVSTCDSEAIAHQMAVIPQICTEDDYQVSFDMLLNHGITPQMKKPPEGSRSPLEASLSKPSGGVLSSPYPKGQGYAESLPYD